MSDTAAVYDLLRELRSKRVEVMERAPEVSDEKRERQARFLSNAIGLLECALEGVLKREERSNEDTSPFRFGNHRFPFDPTSSAGTPRMRLESLFRAAFAAKVFHIAVRLISDMDATESETSKTISKPMARKCEEGWAALLLWDELAVHLKALKERELVRQSKLNRFRGTSR